MKTNKAQAAEAAEEEKPVTDTAFQEEEIIAKIRAGLSREQAIEVIKNQREHDAGVKAETLKS